MSFDLIQYADKYSGRIKMDRIGFVRSEQPTFPDVDLVLNNCAAAFSKPQVIFQRFTSSSFNEDEVFGTDFFRDNPPMVQMRMAFECGLDSLARRSASQVYQNIMDNKSVSTKERFDALMEASLVTLVCDSYTSAANGQQLAECEQILSVANKAAEDAAAVAAKGLSSSAMTDDPSVFYPTPTDTLRCRIMRALSSLVNKNPRACAETLLNLPQTCVDIPDDRICDIATVSDLVMYVVLCSMGTMTREELRNNVIENANFREWLERSDCSVYKTLLESFFNCKWSVAWRTLEVVLKCARLDMFVSRVCSSLGSNIKEKLVLQYCKPYQTISFDVMAKAFDVNKFAMERMILSLIDNGTLSARINGVEHTLSRFTPNARTDAFESTIRAGQEFVDWTDRDLFYTNIIDGGFLEAKFEKEAGFDVLEAMGDRREMIGGRAPVKRRGSHDDFGYDQFDDAPYGFSQDQLEQLVAMGIFDPTKGFSQDQIAMITAMQRKPTSEDYLRRLDRMDHDSSRPYNSRTGGGNSGKSGGAKKHMFW